MAPGRPRAFDIDKALESALRVFWLKGYEGTSMPDLTEAMGINRPSLYAAFGNKEELFRKALNRYGDKACYIRTALQQPTARAVAETMLRDTADALTDPKNPPGCLAVQGALSCGENADPIRRELAAMRTEGQQAFRKRFEKAKADGDLPKDANPADLASYLSTVTQGMAVRAAGGATRKELQRVAEMALKAWP